MVGSGRLSVIVGAFVIVCLGALAIAVLSLTSERGLFTPQYRLVAYFDNVQGLLPGAPVWLAGKEVGRVESITFEAIGSENPVAVWLRVDESVHDRIRANSLATIGTIGLLGDSYVEVSVGTPSSDVLLDGSELVAQSPLNITAVVAKGTRALDEFSSLAENLNTVVTEFQEAGGGRGIASAVDAVSDIGREIQEGSGLLHSVVYDNYAGGGVESIEQSLANLEHILVEVREGDGILHTLIYDSPTDQDLVMEALEAGARLNSILAKVDRGEGTLGLMVNDPSLYEDVKVVLGGAQRSTVMRSLIRMAVDNGEGSPN